MMTQRKTGRKWKTNRCQRCYDAHSGYSGKLDKDNIEYVICGETNKRCNVSGTGIEGNTFIYPTIWEVDDEKNQV